MVVLCRGNALSGGPKDPVVTAFQGRVAEFMKLRNDAEKSAPGIGKKSTPQELAAYRQQLAQEVRARRSAARVGDVFGPELTTRIGKVMQAYLKNRASAQRQAVEDDKPEPPPAKLAVNGAYPADARAMMPPDILAALPPISDGLEYRFVQDDLLLVDTKSGLIVDLVPGALP